MSDHGDINPGAILDFKFVTTDLTGAPFTLAGSPALRCYKDNSVVQDASAITLTVDFDGVTGSNHVRIDTAAAPTFYSAGSNFQIQIGAGTVNGTSVAGYVIGEFSINNRAALRPTTDGETLDVSSEGNAGLDMANVVNQGATLALTGTTIKNATDLAARIPAALISGRMDTFVSAMDAALITQLSGGISPATFVNALLDELLSGHIVAGSVGSAVSTILANVVALLAVIRPVKRNRAIDIPFTMIDVTGRPAINKTITGRRGLDSITMVPVTGTIEWVVGKLYVLHASAADTNGAVCNYEWSCAGQTPAVQDGYKTIYTEAA